MDESFHQSFLKTLYELGEHLARYTGSSPLCYQSGRYGDPGRKLTDPTATGYRAAALSPVSSWALACCFREDDGTAVFHWSDPSSRGAVLNSHAGRSG